MSVEQKIRKFILENYLFTGDESALKNDDSFLGRGIIDSTGILEVIGYLNEELGIKVEDKEMIPDNLDSVNRSVAFVGRKQQTAKAASA
jgi:acyl carrier protein